MYCDGCAVGNTSLALLSPAGAAAGPDAVGAPPLLNLSLERELLFRFFSDFFLKMGIIASQCWDFGWGTWADDFFVDYCLSRSRVAWLPSSRLSSLQLLCRSAALVLGFRRKLFATQFLSRTELMSLLLGYRSIPPIYT